jgi:phosphate starvation-inducible protein PhoH and related proteins
MPKSRPPSVAPPDLTPPVNTIAIEETLHFENARQAQQLFQNEPRHLQAVEQGLNVKITAREGWIKIEGTAENVTRARRLFEVLDTAVRSGQSIRAKDFAYALAVVRDDGPDALANLFDTRILTSTRKSQVTPKTLGQKRYLEAMQANMTSLSASAPPAPAKPTSPWPWPSPLCAKKVSRIILTRPAVEAGEALGFLPGDLYEKIAPYLRPLHDALHDMLPAEEIQKHTERGVIEIAPLAYMRGRTSTTPSSSSTKPRTPPPNRCSCSSPASASAPSAVITGDVTQIDLPKNRPSGLLEALRALRQIDGIAISNSPARRRAPSPRPTHHQRLRGTSRPGHPTSSPSTPPSLPVTRVLLIRQSLPARPVRIRQLRPVVLALLSQILHLDSWELGIHLVGTRTMTRLNEHWLGHPGSTDVITFDHRLTPSAPLHGELFISLPDTLLQARQFHTHPGIELVRYIVHGVLHLQGFDDLNPVPRRRMKRRENTLVGQLQSRFALHAAFPALTSRP